MKTQAGWRLSQLKVKKKWLFPASCSFFFLLSVLMTGCFLWQYYLPKLKTASLGPEATSAPLRMCPQYPEPVPLAHPLPVLKEALEKVDRILRQALSAPGLAAMSAVVIHNDTVLWTGNFGKKNGSDPASGSPNEYTMYRISSVSKIFPVLMLYRLWEEGTVASLDDPLERYASTFTINNPLGVASAPERQSLMDGLEEVGPAPRPSPVTLRRMASQLSGLPRRLRSTSLLWRGSMQEALSLLKDDVLVADPGTRCHYSTLAFSLLAHVLAAHTAQGDYQRWISENVLEPLGMADTGFDLTPLVRARLAAGFYGSGRPAPLYDLGWYRPSGQMYSTPADLAKLATALLGSGLQRLLRPDTAKTLLAPLLACPGAYFANETGTPWEFHAQRGYRVVRKDGDLDGYAATFSLVPPLQLGLVLLLAGPRPPGPDLVAQAYEVLLPAMERALREAEPSPAPPPSARPFEGYFTFANLTFYEVSAGPAGELRLRQFGPRVEALVPPTFRTLALRHLRGRVFQLHVARQFPCALPLGDTWLSLEAQHGQLVSFYPLDRHGLSPGFDVPGLNTYRVLRLLSKPVFKTQ
ncbi:putative beta-lactamase-like 1 isoform X1 [Molossus molossus]|uniref:Lactamase beta like 1 n=2 Tax=Molossus molossus TaxID=27622 RepID=A0A7J8FA73_MOLMO|nr:putative beta-lactamase-like 1 isoform X1 [Molossus molossus]XP_036112661.1 putative beta-lactamase-like 1 isoform X1 [Molossus molossus]KAF6444102.1 lactamase beta like 1 [Molossus molossus]